MKTLILPLFALSLVAFAAPAAAGGCSWMDKSDEQTTEKPKDAQTS